MTVNPSGNFHWIPDYTFEEAINFSNYKTNIPGKTVLRHRHAVKRAFGLRFVNITKTEATDIWNFYNAHSGPYTSFNWTHPTTSTMYKVRFTGSSLKRAERGPDNMDVMVNLIQVF